MAPTHDLGSTLDVPDAVAFDAVGGRTYWVMVTGVRNLSYSDVYQGDFTLAWRPATTPGAPIHVAADRDSQGTIVRWDAPSDDGGDPELDYAVTADPALPDGATIVVDAEQRSARVSGLAPGTSYVFHVTASNLVGSGPVADSAPFVTATDLFGRVTDSGGDPLANICVYTYTADGTRTTDEGVCTDATGAFTMPLSTGGDYLFGLTDPQGIYATTWLWTAPGADPPYPVTVIDGAHDEVDAVMDTVVDTALVGTVTDAATGAPVAGVCLYPADSAGVRTADPGTCTNANGAYVLPLAAGTYTLGIVDPLGRFATLWTAATEVSGGAVTHEDVALTSAVGTGITGRVTDAADDAPLADICVYAYTSTGERTNDPGTCTNSLGAYAMSLSNPGTYRLAFVDPTGSRATVWSTEQVVMADRTTGDVDASL